MTRKMIEFADWLEAQPMESKSWLAREMGIPQQRVQQWTSGERKPTPEQAAFLADMFGVTTDDIYAMTGRIPPDIEAALKNTTPDVFRAIRMYL